MDLKFDSEEQLFRAVAALTNRTEKSTTDTTKAVLRLERPPLLGVYCVVATTQHTLASTFMRPQEYYESPYQNIRGHVFTTEEYEDTYAAHTGAFTYYQDWSGFNIPAETVLSFFENFKLLTRKEQMLKHLLQPMFEDQHRSYLIGIIDGDTRTYDHELAHALYATNSDYRNEAQALLADVPNRDGMEKYLLHMGYDITKIEDERQALLATSPAAHIENRFGINESVSGKFKTLFRKHMLDGGRLDAGS